MHKKPRASSTIPSHQVPMPGTVQEDAEQLPVAVTIYGVSVRIEPIEERWEG